MYNTVVRVVVIIWTHFCLLPQTKENPTFKDNDFTKDNAKLRIGDDVKKDLLQRVKDDVEVSLFVVKTVRAIKHALHQTKHDYMNMLYAYASFLMLTHCFQHNFSTRC